MHYRPSRAHLHAWILSPMTLFLIQFVSHMLNLVHICYYVLISHLSSCCLPHISCPTHSHAHMFPPSYSPYLLVPCVFLHIYKTHKSCMFLQFIYQLPLSISYSHSTYSTYKKLGRRLFFPHEIRAWKDNSIATLELHVETNYIAGIFLVFSS